MQKAFTPFFLFLFFLSFLGNFFLTPAGSISAQEAAEGGGAVEETPDDDYEGVTPSMYSSGEQNFSFSLGLIVPLFYSDPDGKAVQSNVNLGGMGYLAYNYFLTKGLFLGGELGGMFAGTLGENMLYIVPFGLRVGYQFTAWRLEFPISLMIGGATQKYLETDYFGFFLKPSASVFFRLNPDWSFGVNTAWWIVPEWTKESRKNMIGHFLEITLSARYHF
jgi:hypothetical protein